MRDPLPGPDRAATRLQAAWRGWRARDRIVSSTAYVDGVDGCVVVLGLPGSGKTWTLRRAAAALHKPTTLLSVGGIGSGATVEATAWPRTGCKCGGDFCVGHDTPGLAGFRPTIRKAATLSADRRAALLGDFHSNGDGIDVGFEAAGAYRAWWARDVLLPFAIPALYAYGVRHVATESLFLSKRTINVLAATFGSAGRLTLLELSTPVARCARQYSARPGINRPFDVNLKRGRRRIEATRDHLISAKFSPTKRGTLSAASAVDHMTVSLRRVQS